MGSCASSQPVQSNEINVPIESSDPGHDGIVLYMDYNATTPIDPRVLDAMHPALTCMFGNPSAKTYKHGWDAMAAVNKARTQVAKLINAASSNEIIFTSGATECNGMAIRGIFDGLDHSQRLHFITSKMEHNCVLEAAKTIELDPRGNVDVTYLGVPEDGVTTAAAVAQHVRDSTVLISIMLVNNEIGVRNEIEKIGELCRRSGVLFHVDAAQALGKLPVDVQQWHVDLMSSSSHKLYGPKGIGALYVREAVKPRLTPLLKGGGQEGGLRGGTHNVPAIVGFGAACEVAREEMPAEIPRLKRLRDDLLAKLQSGVTKVRVNGSMQNRVAGNLSVSFPGVDGEALLTTVNTRLAVSSGSACKAASGGVSHVMSCLGVPADLARATLRFGLGRWTTEEDVNLAAEVVVKAVNKLYNPCKQLYIQKTHALLHDNTANADKYKENATIHKVSDGLALTMERSGTDSTASSLASESTGTPSSNSSVNVSGQLLKKNFKREELRTTGLDKLVKQNALDHLSGSVVIGHVSNQYDTPQYIEWRVVESRIKVEREWIEALNGVDGYSHLIVVWMMNLVGEKKTSHVPQGLYGSVPTVGIFACRCPQRPNPIAITTVQLLGMENEDTLVVRGLDAVNGSPVLDIKPYDPKWDDLSVIRPGEKIFGPDWTHNLTY